MSTFVSSRQCSTGACLSFCWLLVSGTNTAGSCVVRSVSSSLSVASYALHCRRSFVGIIRSFVIVVSSTLAPLMGYGSDCASRTKVREGTHTADGNSQEALHVLTVEQPVRTHARFSANINRAAFAFPAAEHDMTPLATPRPLARRRWARGLHQGRHGGTADLVRVTP